MRDSCQIPLGYRLLIMSLSNALTLNCRHAQSVDNPIITVALVNFLRVVLHLS
jgi:hypothetical protein